MRFWKLRVAVLIVKWKLIVAALETESCRFDMFLATNSCLRGNY